VAIEFRIVPTPNRVERARLNCSILFGVTASLPHSNLRILSAVIHV